ncbi:hypothetical protein GWI33_014968 [Rhynchophorus ferrugineus]|uniref:Uncharacterized protein n=1 Tax=Rhynchophorus ferrugineus TaxID=354439 RepID=A0A834IE63_RHYFE|nr:hypothetical protein GWI33_014968 [Rhynchophorus ferrugineus]
MPQTISAGERADKRVEVVGPPQSAHDWKSLPDSRFDLCGYSMQRTSSRPSLTSASLSLTIGKHERNLLKPWLQLSECAGTNVRVLLN